MSNSRRETVVFVGALPPPLHGMATVNRDMVEKLRNVGPCVALPICETSGTRGIARHLTKARRALAALLGLICERVSGAKRLYIAADDGLGGLWTLQVVLLGRLLGYTIFVHHHSYRYLLVRARIMSSIVAVGGAKCRHVVLCDEMADEFARIYPRAKRFIVAPNTVAHPIGGTWPPPRPNRPFTIGMLSNLTFEKGVDDFVTLLETLMADGADVRGVLAGPASTPEVDHFIRTNLNKLDGKLTWLGHVSGEAKEDFFRNIDYFVFPTKYASESFGLVILEALIRGVPVSAVIRGCVCVFAASKAAHLVSKGQTFIGGCRGVLMQLISDPVALRELAQAAARDGRSINAKHAVSQDILVNRIVSEED